MAKILTNYTNCMITSNKNEYKKIILLNAGAIAEALARGYDVQITTAKAGLKIKILDIKLLKQENTQAGEK